MKRLPFVLSAALVLSTLGGCVALPAAPAPSPGAAPAAGDVASMDSRRDIVLAVANPLEPAATHAGSNLLGYAPTGNYGAGQRAASALADIEKAYGVRTVTGWPIRALGLYCVVLKPPAGVDRDALIARLAADKRVQLAQPLQDYSVYGDAGGSQQAAPQDGRRYNDPYTDLQRGFVETRAAVAHTVTQGDGVHVAVVDTGADMSHPDLRDHVRDGGDAVDDDAAAFNGDRHGTEVAGIIAAEGDNHQGMVGIAPKSRISVYKACWYPDPGKGARCNSFTLAKALAAVNDTDARIVNMSLGGPADPLLGKLLGQLLSRGRIVVAALPPDGSTGGFPDNAPGVIVVRSSAAVPAAPGVVSAPGKDILTTQPGGGYDFTSGSSMAAAHVSGILALLLSLSPRLDANSAREILLRTSSVTHGMREVNAAAAVAALGAGRGKP
ncbi:S8 family serine peptidase [Luteibacter yeojuensis]|uniref:S8 family serine peptidase n=1 Tax=Luteibacter yeojuensis TaxID=345309 RepID=A0A7X5QV30_9GAMM|nr:S8 family serine peptidase [Luteibacter yeojuensis]NID15953.1 S8 family serine peptidase [Luteibacter yeojuensis]